MSPGRLRAALVVGLAVLLAGGGYWLFGRDGGANEEGYVTEPVDRGPIAAVVTATGTVNPVTMVQVGTYVSGPIRAIDVDYNSPVRKGQRVAKIDPAPFQVKVDQAQANLANARARVSKSRADLELKKLTLERSRQLLAQNLISQSELDTAGSDHAQAAAQIALDLASVDQVKAALEEARINLAYTDIVSPVDGVVVSRNVDVGQTVAASFQTPTLFEIAQDLAEMQVDSNVSESDIGGVHAGQTASFGVDAYPGRVFGGTVVQVRNAPLIVQNVVTYDVVVQVDNSSLELKPGMTAMVTITTDRRDDAVRVPVRALRFKPEADSDGDSAAPAAGPREAGEAPPTVWLAEPGGRLRPVEIRTGLRNDRYVELLSDGLAPGDPVAVAYRRPPASEPPARSPFAPARPR